MKKIISFVVLSVLLTALILPGLTSAQSQTPKECCLTNNRVIDLGDATNDCAVTHKVAAPDVTAAGECLSAAVANDVCGNEDWGMYCLVNTIRSVTNWIFYLLMIFVVVMIVIGGATYMLASGDPEKAGKGKSIIIYAIVGLVIALIARLIPSVVKMIVGMS